MTDDDSDDDVRLLPQDYEAAEKHVLSFTAIPEHERGSLIKGLAQRHAALGPRLFRITLGLEQPRHSWERVEADRWRQLISTEECRQRYEAVLREPLTEALLQVYCDDMDQCIIHYNRLFSAAQFVIDEFRKHGYRRDASDIVSWHAREIARPTSLLKRHTIAIGEWALECRVSRGLPNAVTGSITRATGTLLCCFATRRASELWFEHLEDEHRRQTVDHELQLAAFEFLRNYYGKLPGSDELQSLLLQEITVMKQELRKSGPPTFWNDKHPLVADLNTDPVTNTPVPSKPKTPVLSNWAFGYDATKQKWWLFYRRQGRWDPRKLVVMPKGFRSAAMLLFIEKHGRVSRTDLLPLLVDGKARAQKTKPDARLDQGITRLRTSVLQAIPGFDAATIKMADNPLPLNSNGDYIAAVEIGWAEPDEDQPDRMRFRLQKDL